MKLPDALFTGLYGLGLVEAACLGIGQAVDIAVQDVLEDFEIREFLMGTGGGEGFVYYGI